jgi:hypothetical protein
VWGRENIFYLAKLIRIDENIRVDVPTLPDKLFHMAGIGEGGEAAPGSDFQDRYKQCIQNGKSKSASVRAFSA